MQWSHQQAPNTSGLQNFALFNSYLATSRKQIEILFLHNANSKSYKIYRTVTLLMTLSDLLQWLQLETSGLISGRNTGHIVFEVNYKRPRITRELFLPIQRWMWNALFPMAVCLSLCLSACPSKTRWLNSWSNHQAINAVILVQRRSTF